ncbi:EamA-like transporter family protein [Pseudomonas gingeri NCPPB 3146 = LMG 5327]|uniref:DMT family transporter n=2 Tax=Pseudomonas gingeri TaxID=117681 RepID=A0A7Y8CB45_9PSED|nr:DMT family transporter [Pseudomonas gingeri]NWC12344.1 DMT family transporter [Pseudomonas gingeri]NWE47694.1 DMT family transporter [Pseudomonas gingeri]NWE69700.1 DMT family transporter [Pseudomonas gingeri]PNQ88577.1 EamA-like transporter family protein [Pseudomonas gingeri NCPPB 3146 = LMG 5327]
MILLSFVLAFVAGVAIAVQAAVNSQLAVSMMGNTFSAAFYSFFTGMLLLGIIAVTRGGVAEAVAAIPAQPWWRLVGGVLGAGAIFCTVWLAPRIGLANLLVLVIAGQLLSSMAIDHFGWLGAVQRQVVPVKLVGACVLLLGVALTLFGERLLAWLSRVF